MNRDGTSNGDRNRNDTEGAGLQKGVPLRPPKETKQAPKLRSCLDVALAFLKIAVSRNETMISSVPNRENQPNRQRSTE